MRAISKRLSSLVLLAATAVAQQSAAPAPQPIGFDSNNYPGDAALPALRRHFAFAGYWLTNPPGARENSWKGKRQILLQNGFGFLVLADGRLEAEIGKAKRSGTPPAALGENDAAEAV